MSDDDVLLRRIEALGAEVAKANAERDEALAKVSYAQSYGWRHALYAAATTAHSLIAMAYVADNVRDRILSLMTTSPWRPIAEADLAITQVQDFSEAGITLRNSDRYWVRDEDGRIYEASWSDDKAGYWWDWEGESPVDPVEFMPHPLDPRWTATKSKDADHG